MAKQNFVWLKTTYFGKPDIIAAKISCPNLGNSQSLKQQKITHKMAK